MPRILLVEDDDAIREMLARRLRKKNFEVLVAVDGQEACSKAQAEKPDLILMDLFLKPRSDSTLPVLDGYEASRRLKEAGDTRSIPIIALTAHAMAGDREKALAAGCDEYEAKPIDLPVLLEKIAGLLQRKTNS
jgi:CheY-like chemotaxis protein